MHVDLARLLEVGKVTIGGLVDRLESSGHVQRRPDPKDRLAKRVYITDQGWKMIRSMISVAEKMNRKVMAGVSVKELETVERVLLAIKDNIKIGRAHVCTPVTNEHLACQHLFEQK